ncbi:MAG: hypothetical protein KDB53_05080, partial [Planctomycetes bacterium]|nr:hypothetical protein [Planctomycetota bacterium]
SIRDAVRLVATGYEPHQLLAELARDDARRAEYGTTHVLAVAADCGRFLKSRPGAAAVYAIAPVIDLSIEESQRLSAHPAVEAATDLPDDDAAICHRLNAAVEAEDLPRAESILRGAHAMGRVRSTIETWLFDLLAEHFLSFGHPLIYLIKARELLDRVGDAAARDIHCGLLRGIVYGTREDTLPYMRAYAQRLAEATVELEDLHRRQDTTADAAFDARAFVDAVLDAPSPGGACDQLMAALRAGVSAQLIAESLVIAGAHRFARFDVAHEQNPDLAENWLWATHRFTFAAAVRHAVAGFDRPRSLRFLFQALMFIHSGRRMDLPLEARENSILSGPAGEGASAQAIMEAIGKKDATSAVRRLRSLLRNRDEAALRQLRVALEAFCLNDPVVRPIVLAHVIKLVVAAFEEWEHLADQEEAGIPLLGLVRFLASPIQERRVHSAVHASIGWVVEGLVPRKLTQ